MILLIGLAGADFRHFHLGSTHEPNFRRSAAIMAGIGREGMTLTLTGTALGLAASAGLTRFTGFLLYGISPLDPWAFLAVPVLLTLVALAAGMVPALRSTRISPVDALRYQ